ncbi:MAG: TRAP transporter substrate-binding protein [Rhodospirillales bacterium]|nr:TRAP transporter substrate-binding protein [Rhodospirillales bacterium]
MKISKLRGTMIAGALGVAFVMTGVMTTPVQSAEVTLKLHHLLPPVAPAHQKMLVPWANNVMKESGGKIKVDIYPAMQLGGKPPQLAQQAKDGFVDIVWTVLGYTPGRFTKVEVFELPFFHSNTVTTNKALWDYTEKNGDEFKDYKLIALHVHAGQAFHSIKPIRTADDLKGLKIRTPTRTGGWMIEAMGATPIGSPVPKIPEMLSKKVVDAVLIPYEVTMALKVHELVDFHTTLDDPLIERINTTTFMIAMNKKKYDSLSPELRKVIDKNSGASQAEWIGKVWQAAEGPGYTNAAKSGEMIKMAPAEVAKLRARTEGPVTERWVSEMKKKGADGNALIAEAKALMKKYSK